MGGLVEHFETHLGPIADGWSADADGNRMPFQVVRFERGPGPRTVTFATLGLSRYELHSSTSGRRLFQELVVAVPEARRDGPVPGLLQQLGQEAINSRHAWLRGDVIGPRGPLVAGSALSALYVTVPVYWPDSFAQADEDGRQIALCWLVPIAANEAEFVRTAGWSAFEDALQEADPDLLDLGRPALAL